MGQPKFPRKKYQTPNHPWQGDRIKEEHEIVRKFGLKNKREIWKAQSRLRDMRGQARTLVSATRNPDDSQASKEASNLLTRLYRLGYTGEGATLNEVLGLDLERVLNRRLQSQVYLKGMARTMKQARQFVNHGVVRVGDRRVTIPSYIVSRDEEGSISFHPDAAVSDEMHPVRPKAPGQEIEPVAREPEPVAEPEPVVEEAAPEAPAEEPGPQTPAEAPAEEAAPTATEAPAEVAEEAAPEAAPEETPAPADATEEAPATEEAKE